MNSVLEVIIWIVIVLGILSGIGYGIYIAYKKLNKKGTCQFVPFSPNSTSLRDDTQYLQTGYISCSGGGALWSPGKLTVLNNGPGTFYLGPIEGQANLVELDSGDTLTFTKGGTDPSVYYDSTSDQKTPNFSITII